MSCGRKKKTPAKAKGSQLTAGALLWLDEDENRTLPCCALAVNIQHQRPA